VDTGARQELPPGSTGIGTRRPQHVPTGVYRLTRDDARSPQCPPPLV